MMFQINYRHFDEQFDSVAMDKTLQSKLAFLEKYVNQDIPIIVKVKALNRDPKKNWTDLDTWYSIRVSGALKNNKEFHYEVKAQGFPDTISILRKTVKENVMQDISALSASKEKRKQGRKQKLDLIQKYYGEPLFE